MNKADKQQFIEDICARLRDDMLNKVDDMPENWNGFEIRQLFADYASEQINFSMMSHKQKRRYENDRANRNI